MMPDIKVDFTILLERYLTPLVLCFTVGLIFYIKVFDKNWEWPTVIGCGLFLLIQAGIWMKGNYDWNRNIENLEKLQKEKEAIIKQANFSKEQKIKEEAKIFLNSCLDCAVGLYKYPRRPGEKEYERYVYFGDEPGYHYALEISQFELDIRNQKYQFLISENNFSSYSGSPIHVVFHPILYNLIGKFVETGNISFS